MSRPSDRRITIGRIVGLFGVRGWVKVYSHTRPREAILGYSPWLLDREGEVQAVALAEGASQGKGIVARLDGVVERDQAAKWVGAEITVHASQLAPLKDNEYYWAELEGLRVVDQSGTELGVVSHLLETGAQDVMVVRGDGERLIPFGAPVVKRVDRAAGVIYVEWEDPE